MSKALKGTTVRRGGLTAYYWYETIESVFIEAAAELRLRFMMSSKGGGHTQVQVEIRPESFPHILEMMAAVDHEAATQAMASELSRQVRLQPERHAAAILEAKKKARGDIQQRAWDKYFPSQRIVYEGVKEIVSEANQRRV